jgi:hypothetical protein
MLQMPRRSVTRFFIPLIDVLTLLFCIFLMMPAVKKASDAEAAAGVTDPLARRQRDLDEREKALADTENAMHLEINRVRREAAEKEKKTTEKVLNNLSTRVFEIDPKTGELYYRDPDRVNVTKAKQAADLIRRDRDRAGAGREIYYLILYPRDPLTGGGVPSREQKDRYEDWFKNVPHRYDIPWKPDQGGEEP